MSPPTSAPEVSGSTSTGQASTRAGAARPARITLLYLVVAILLPLAAVPVLIALGRSDVFLHHGASLWVRVNDQAFSAHDRTCDTLIYGDSTALTGLDPEIIERATRGPVCNIAMTNAVLAVTGDLALDRFLARNSRPRILLIQLSPESFSTRAHWEQTVYAEGMLELLRWGDAPTIRRTLLSHPRESLAFAGYTAGFAIFYLIKQAWQRVTGERAGEDAVLVRNGFFTAPLPALTRCDYALPPPAHGDRAASIALVKQLRDRYERRADHLLINVSPVPDCDSSLAPLQTELQGLTSNALTPLPVRLFNDERHFTAAGALLLSERAASQIASLPGPPRIPPRQLSAAPLRSAP